MPLRIRTHVKYPILAKAPAPVGRKERPPSLPWTPEHDALVRSIYPTEGAAPLVKILNRTREAIGVRAGIIGVKYTAGFSWSRSKDDLLQQLWRTLSASKIAAIIGCSQVCVYERVRALGLQRNRTGTKKHFVGAVMNGAA